MKKLFILASAAAMATAVYGNNVTYWITGSNPNRTLPYITGTTTTDTNDNIVFGMTGGTLTATVTDDITSASSKMQFSGSQGVAGDSTITINEGFTYNMYQVTVGAAQNMVDGAVVNYTGNGTLTFNETINLSNATNHVTWNFSNSSTVLNVSSTIFNVGQNNIVTINNLVHNNRAMVVTIGSGSVFKVVSKTAVGGILNNFTVDGGTFDLTRNQNSYWSFRGNANINSLSDDAYIGYLGVDGTSAVITIGAGLEHNIISGNKNITFWNGTMVLNSSNVFKYGDQDQSNIGIECAGASTKVGITLGADNDFWQLKSNSGSKATVFTLDLNGYAFTLGTLTATNFSSIIVKDFADDLLRVKDLTGFDMAKLVVYSDDGSTLISNDDLEMKDMGTYYALSMKAIPEPAEWAFIFGALALAFAAYRRRK